MKMAITSLIFIAALTSLGNAERDPSAPPPQNDILTIGALLPLHGEGSNYGISAQIALKTAEADINKHFSDFGRTIRLQVVVEDTRTDPDITLKALKALQTQGIRIIIGPEQSQCLANVREYADQNGIILISGGSTAQSLAIENDTTFRLVPDDATLAHLLAFLMQRDGIKVLIPLARRDLWADGMLNATKHEFNGDGRIMLDAVRYDPQTTNFSSQLSLLRSQVRNATEGYGENRIAIYVSAFDEIVTILSQASGDPVLCSVRWYGNDLTNAAISQNKTAADFALSVNFLSPVIGGIYGPKYERIKKAIFNETGLDACSLAANDYDALWLITYTYLLAESHDAQTFKQAFPVVAERYRGEFGWMKLNDAGDLENVPYTIANLKKDNDTFQWVPYAIL
ncbi:MAG: Receptor family ligand binding region [Methanosaeta sp. PtaU1.Bin112]|nr:MAG: Receptor family ligand binding region [Methanosaeta sp. PtaU1.Bin112]